MSQRLLLRGGLVIDTEPGPVVRRDTDVLIEDGRIAAVGRDLGVTDAEVIDASDRIVLPGFVDTHRHLWEVALRGTAVDVDLMTYLQRILGEYGSRYRAEDVAAGNLVGALECLDAGITTVQDYSHVQQGIEHADAALDALMSSGIRAVYGYGQSPLTGAAVDPTGMRHVVGRASGRITVALAAIGPAYSPLEVVRADWELAASLGLPIVVHVGSGPVAYEPLALLRDEGLLRPDVLYVHGNTLADSELKLIAESGASVSITPAVEARMEMGDPMATRLRAAGVTTGLGIDVVTSAPGDMFSAMQSILALGYKSFTAAEVLQLATLEGARALGLDDQIGSLRPGKQADIIMLRASDINLIGGSQDPIGTVVTAAHPGNIDTVLVDGQPVKRDGRLLAPGLPAALEAVRRTVDYLAA
ncbi:cytosine/adenosine deaminase-related metal-dependent hydrolase [Kribbella voronezhensis]|uniref:Cytosine/adenosine deaminase-related metal-dependent hydrolase n=1 Tax=Kribbella voronezhensis TaxID=2512212 RepID=A0A4R7TEP5_9ACTN|nr:amidohydrolase family protein [Kribbella voronezhensis]TDU90625.1 cytosine/adenosine deaminase-related metal-dependent hydrolase [Kribbella voronezhensis]